MQFILIRFNPYVAPACIFNNFNTNGIIEAAGYGQTGFVEKKANKLMKVNLDLMDQNKCKDYYHNFDEYVLAKGIVEEQFCAKSTHYGSTVMDTW